MVMPVKEQALVAPFREQFIDRKNNLAPTGKVLDLTTIVSANDVQVTEYEHFAAIWREPRFLDECTWVIRFRARREWQKDQIVRCAKIARDMYRLFRNVTHSSFKWSHFRNSQSNGSANLSRLKSP